MTDVVEHADVGRYGTLGTPSIARFLVHVHDEREALAARAFARDRGLPAFVLGGGSNVVLPDRYEGVVIRNAMRGFRVLEDDGRDVELEVAAGEQWHELVRRTLGMGLCGLESMALVPGTVGAAPVQNIGAYGGELADVFVQARVLLHARGESVAFAHADCAFAYRDSVFKRLGDDAEISSVRLRLRRLRASRAHYAEIERELLAMGRPGGTAVDYAEAVTRVRRRKLPDVRHYGNVGSFFHNPILDPRAAEGVFARDPSLASLARPERTPAGDGVKLPAAALIERCGWRGRRIGAVEAWRRQPLVLVNHGGARRGDVLDVARRIGDDVAERFGVALSIEPRTRFPGSG